MDILDDMGVSKLSAKDFFKVNYSFKYLGVILDSQLSFQKHAKNVANIIQFNLANMPEAAKLFMHSMVFSHITYCFTSWCQGSTTHLKQLNLFTNNHLKHLIGT